MTVLTQYIEMKIPPYPEIIKITGQIERILRSSQLKEGLLNLWINGHGVGLTALHCPEGIVPQTHFKPLVTQFENPELCGSLLGHQLSLPFEKQKLPLVPWQELVLIPFFKSARWHQLTVQILGE